MKNNRLIIALVVFVGVGMLAYNASRSHESESSVAEPSATLPTVKSEEVDTIEIERPKEPAITIVKKGDAWEMTAPVTAKADKTAVDAALDKLTALEVTGVAATRKENHERLQVDADKAIRVKAKQGDKVLADLFIGETKKGNTMVRAEGNDVVLSVRGSMRYAFDKEVKLFRDRVVTDIDTKELTGMTVDSEKGSFAFEKNDENKWTQAKGQKPIKHFAESKVESLASSLARLRAADFGAPDLTADAAGLAKPTAKVTFTKKEGEPIVIELGQSVENDYYLRTSGKEIIYRISKYTGDRMIADAEAFAKDPEAEKKAEAAAPPPSMPMGGPGANQLPPELMRQLQEQMAQQSPH